jgi:hypothetical protein
MREWCAQFGIEELPPPLPSPAERSALRANVGPDNPAPVRAAWLRTAGSMVDYLKPWPSSETRAKIESPLDGVKSVACWIHGRLLFVERLAGVTEDWNLYAPGVRTAIGHVRARLTFSDGTDAVLLLSAEPADYTHFNHWFEDKINNYDGMVMYGDAQSCWGYCNQLAHRYAQNPSGAALVRIVLFKVALRLAPPGVDAKAHYLEQHRLTLSPPRNPMGYGSDQTRAAAQVLPDFYEFDPLTKAGWMLDSGAP